MAKYHGNLLRDSPLSLLSTVRLFSSWETKIILDIPNETFLRITRYLLIKPYSLIHTFASTRESGLGKSRWLCKQLHYSLLLHLYSTYIPLIHWLSTALTVDELNQHYTSLNKHNSLQRKITWRISHWHFVLHPVKNNSWISVKWQNAKDPS